MAPNYNSLSGSRSSDTCKCDMESINRQFRELKQELASAQATIKENKDTIALNMSEIKRLERLIAELGRK